MRNALITGLPRSGTTLVCHLLNKLPNVVALHEPMNPFSFADKSDSDILKDIETFFQVQRRQIITEGTATSKSKGGSVPTNSLSDAINDNSRKILIDGTEIQVHNVDSIDFDLFIKHPSFFTSTLPLLERHYECFACIRNPLSILLSWMNANMAVTEGRAPAAEKMDPKLTMLLDKTPDRQDRQVMLIDFFFSRYLHAKLTKIVRYEDVISSRGKAMKLLHPMAEVLSENLSSRNARNIKSEPEVHRLAERLLASDNACWAFYSRESVIELLKNDDF